MAVGDIITGIPDVSAASSVDIQPASGDEYVMTCAVGVTDNTTNTNVVFLTDGTNNSTPLAHPAIGIGDGGGVADRGVGFTDGKVFINNTYYLRIMNKDAGSSRRVWYSGIQTVD